MRRWKRCLGIQLPLILILSCFLDACQTGKDHSNAEKATEVFESQKALVRSHLDAGKPDLALGVARDLLKKREDDASVQTLMGLCHLALQNPARAVRHFTQAYKLEATAASALNLSSAYLEAGEFHKATRLLLALTRSPKGRDYQHKERIYHNLGYAHARLNNTAKAEQWLNEALDENPTYYPSQVEIAQLYAHSKRPAMAVKAYQKASDSCVVCYEPVEALAKIYMQMGRLPEARRVLLRFSKAEGVGEGDKRKAQKLIQTVTTAGLQRDKGPAKGSRAALNSPKNPKR